MVDAPTEQLPLAAYRTGNLDPDALNQRIAEVWTQALADKDARQEIAEALEVSPDDLKQGSVPISVTAPSGFDPAALIHVVGHDAMTYVAVPVLVGITKDLLKDRLTRLWTDVILPRIKRTNEGALRE